MERKKLYTAISAIIGLILLFGLGSYLYYSLKNSFYFSIASFIGYLPSLLGITGILLFYFSGFKRSGLFRLYMCIEIFSFPFILWFYISYLTRSNGFGYTNDSRFTITLLIGVFLTLLLTACCCAGLWYLTKEKSPKITYIRNGDEVAGQFEPASGGLRFANRVVDVSVMFFVIFQYVFSNRLFSIDMRTGSYLGFTLIEIPSLIIYYLLMEGIFNTSAGKCATNTTIVNEYAARPGFAQILGRTFCRIIPFDGLSFLAAGARGWHDSIPNTYVVAAVNQEDAVLDEITLDAELNQQAL